MARNKLHQAWGTSRAGLGYRRAGPKTAEMKLTLDDRTSAALARLTDNEKQCLRRRLLHQTAKEMALDLGVSPHAVEKRLKMARTKLGLSSSLDAARLLAAAERGYGLPVPQPSDLSSATAPADPSPRHRISRPAIWISGVTFMSIVIAAALLLVPSAQPPATPRQDTPQAAPAATVSWARISGGAEGETRKMRKADPAEIRRFLAESFAATDRDHSGFIERSEAPEAAASPAHPKGQQPSKQEGVWIMGKGGQALWMARVDANEDGRVSEAEYVAFTTPAFSASGIPADWKPRG